MRFGQLFTIAVYALTPAVILDSALPFAKLHIPTVLGHLLGARHHLRDPRREARRRAACRLRRTPPLRRRCDLRPSTRHHLARAGAALTTDRRDQRLQDHRALRRGRAAVQGVRAREKSVTCETFGTIGRAAADGRAHRRRAGQADAARAGRHPRRRDRRQGRGLPAPARAARRQASPGVALDKVRVVFVPVFNVDGHERFGAHNRPNQSRPRGDGLAHHRAEPQPQPRLREGRRARDARDADAARARGSDRLHGPPRHRRRGVPARRRGAGRARRRPATMRRLRQVAATALRAELIDAARGAEAPAASSTSIRRS